MNYKQQLRHPKWLRKRNEIMDRDNYQCQLCKSREKHLHVHHLYYEPNKKSWDYDSESLVTLCEDCHKYVHSSLPKIISLAVFPIIKEGACVFDIITKLEAEKEFIPF